MTVELTEGLSPHSRSGWTTPLVKGDVGEWVAKVAHRKVALLRRKRLLREERYVVV